MLPRLYASGDAVVCALLIRVASFVVHLRLDSPPRRPCCTHAQDSPKAVERLFDVGDAQQFCNRTQPQLTRLKKSCDAPECLIR